MFVYPVAEEDERDCGCRPCDCLYVCAGNRPCKPPQPHRQHWCPNSKAKETLFRSEAAVGETAFTNGVAVVEPGERADEETEGNEQKDWRGLLSVPRVVCVDEREGNSEEVEERGAKCIG